MSLDQLINMIDTCAIVEMTEESYHATSAIDDHITRSMIVDYIDSPDGFKLRHIDKLERVQKERSAAMDLGNYFDDLITMGDMFFDTKYRKALVDPTPSHWLTPSGGISKSRAVVAEIDKAIAEGRVIDGVSATRKAWVAAVEKQGGQPLDEVTADTARFMRDRLMDNPLAKRIVDTSDKMQLTIRMTLVNGLNLQVRMDFYSSTLGVIADLKTTRKRKQPFLRSAIDMGYHIQDVLYSAAAVAAGLTVNHPMLFVCCMNTYPWDSYVTQMPDEVRDWACKQCIDAIEGIHAQNWGELQTAAYVPYTEYWLANLIDSSMS